MLKIDHLPLFDNHTHCISVGSAPVSALDLALAFCHGWGPVLPYSVRLGTSAELCCCDAEYEQHTLNTGVYKTLICQLARYYGCEANPETVVQERNRRTSLDGMAYAKSLYEDVGIAAEVVDEGVPMNDPSLIAFQQRYCAFSKWIRPSALSWQSAKIMIGCCVV